MFTYSLVNFRINKYFAIHRICETNKFRNKAITLYHGIFPLGGLGNKRLFIHYLFHLLKNIIANLILRFSTTGK